MATNKTYKEPLRRYCSNPFGLNNHLTNTNKLQLITTFNVASLRALGIRRSTTEYICAGCRFELFKKDSNLKKLSLQAKEVTPSPSSSIKTMETPSSCDSNQIVEKTVQMELLCEILKVPIADQADINPTNPKFKMKKAKELYENIKSALQRLFPPEVYKDEKNNFEVRITKLIYIFEAMVHIFFSKF